MKERLFTPWSLARVCEAVDWEDDLVERKDGTTNQEQYIKAVAILWERWVRGWSLPDFLAALNVSSGEGFFQVFVRILTSLPERVYQLKGFYEGLWAGANPDVEPRSRAILSPLEGSAPIEQRAAFALQAWWEQTRAIVCVPMEGTNV